MIALRGEFPLIQYEDGHVVPYGKELVLPPLLRAADKAGYRDWWLAEHVAQSITVYLRLSVDENLLPIRRLAGAVQSVLQVIGYSEVAEHFVPDPPLIQVSLVELATEAGSGYELAFFKVLSARIHELLERKNSRFEMYGLERCVKKLRERKVWSRDCDALRAEIVCYVREQIESASGSQQIELALS